VWLIARSAFTAYVRQNCRFWRVMTSAGNPKTGGWNPVSFRFNKKLQNFTLGVGGYWLLCSVPVFTLWTCRVRCNCFKSRVFFTAWGFFAILVPVTSNNLACHRLFWVPRGGRGFSLSKPYNAMSTSFVLCLRVGNFMSNKIIVWSCKRNKSTWGSNIRFCLHFKVFFHTNFGDSRPDGPLEIFLCPFCMMKYL
jgi:hypothetical protein